MPTSTVKQELARIDLPQVQKRSGPNPKRLIQSFRGKTYVPASYLALVLVSVFVGPLSHREVGAQTLRAQIKIVSLAPARVQVDLELPAATDVLSFRNAHGGVLGLADRIERLEGNVDGRSIQVKKLGPGEYQVAVKFTRFRYEVDVTEPAQPSQMSHVSWLNKVHGLLMLADLLPRAQKSAGSVATSVRIEMPVGWAIASNLAGGELGYVTDDPDKAVFLLGPSVLKRTRRIGATEFSIVTSGKWPFSDGDVLKAAEKLIKEYSNVTGHTLKSDAVLILLPFADEAGPERWTAETRGNAIVLLLGNKANRQRVLAKLGIVLSHEIFHLWVPNALALEGDYDWFFEGFTLYQALRMALRLKLISFETFLETIARVYDSYSSSADRDRLSLIEASERRWTTASSVVYDKGMLAAFLYDLTLRTQTDCQQSLDDVYRQLFRQHATGQGSANETIIRVLSEPPNMNSFGGDYVAGKGQIHLQSALSSYGIQLRSGGPGGQATKLKLGSDLNKAQRKALHCIGYRG